MKALSFNQFINENQDNDDLKQLADLGLYTPIAEIVYQTLIEKTDLAAFMTLEGDSILFKYDWIMEPADSLAVMGFDEEESRNIIRKLGMGPNARTKFNDFFGLIDIVLDFNKMTISVHSDINQRPLNFKDDYSHEGPMSNYVTVLDDYYGKASTGPTSAQEIANELVRMFLVWSYQEDPFGIWININTIIEKEIKNRLERANHESGEDS